MISKLNKKFLSLYFVPFIGGVLYATGFPMKFAPTNFFGTIIGLALLFQALSFSKEEVSNKKMRVEILSVLAFCLGYNCLGYYWIPYTMKTFGGLVPPLNYLMGSLFSLIIAPHLITFVVTSRIFYRFSKRIYALTNSNAKKNFIYAIIFTLLEQIVPQQFPSHAGHSWLVIAPFLGLAKVFGAPLFSFINFWLALGLADVLRGKTRDWWSIRFASLVIFTSAVFPLILSKKSDHITSLRLVQARISNNVKIDSEVGSGLAFSDVKKVFYKLSTKESENDIDLIIWPETAYPRLLSPNAINKNPTTAPHLITSIIDKMNAEMFIGGYELKANSSETEFFESQYNAAFHFGINHKVKDTYHKIKLIPFGESLPFGPFNKYLTQINSNLSFFSSGARSPIFTTKSGSTFSAVICYEVLFSSFMRKWLNSNKTQPDFIINITNDSWYGDTAEPFQHLFLAKWRALEFNVPIVRMTNTGITSVIYPDGSESKRLGVGEKGILDIELKTQNRDATIFQKFGLFPILILWLVILGLFKFSTKYTKN